IGGGLPVGAYGGRKDIMDFVSPAGPVYQAGTLSGNPMAMAAGLTLLKVLRDNPSLYGELDGVSEMLAQGLRGQLKQFTVNRVGSMMTLFFTDKEVVDYDTAKASDTALFGKYFNAMLRRGVYLPPSQFEAMFVSHAITPELVERILAASAEAVNELSPRKLGLSAA